MWLDERFNICEFTYSSFTYFHVEALPVPRQMLTGCLLGKGNMEGPREHVNEMSK